MPERTQEQIEQILRDQGIVPGMYVSWTTHIGKRYGCVLGYLPKGMVKIQASNGQFPIQGSCLKPEPDCDDAITADLIETYGPKPWKST